MISLVMASAMYMTAMQAGVSEPRSAFASCLKQASEKAKTEKVAPDAFSQYATSMCAAQAEAFKAAVIKFDMKNGIGRKDALSNAELQIEDYLIGSTENYQARNRPAQAAAKAQ